MIKFLLPKRIFPSGKIIYISDKKIIQYPIRGVLFIIFSTLFFTALGAGIYFFSVRLNSSSHLTQTELEIKRLRQVNENLKNHLNSISQDIDAFNDYLESQKVKKNTTKSTQAASMSKSVALPTSGSIVTNQQDQVAQQDNLPKESENITQVLSSMTDKITLAHRNIRLSIEDKMRAAKALNLDDSLSIKSLNDEFNNAGYIYKVSFNQAIEQIASQNLQQNFEQEQNILPSAMSQAIDLLTETQKIYLDNLNLKYKISILKKLDSLIANAPSERPMDFYTRISSYFGGRIDPKGHYHAFHHGIDIVGEKNEKIKAVADGMVIKAGILGGYGNYIEVNHGHGIKTGYAHLSKILVSQGDKVKKGDIIAVQGSTGKSTGDHLHYEVKVGGVKKNPLLFMKPITQNA
jgi:murein DD-endopeptidase MepM/ murein hydrolase activator NlpD